MIFILQKFSYNSNLKIKLFLKILKINNEKLKFQINHYFNSLNIIY